MYAGFFEYMKVTRRTSGTRHGFRVRKGTRRCFRVRVIVIGCAPGGQEYTQVIRRVLNVRVKVFEYASRITGTRHGFRVLKGTRRCFRIRVIVLGCALGVLEYSHVPDAFLRCVSWYVMSTRRVYRVRVMF